MKCIFALIILLLGFNQLHANESSTSPIIYIYDASGFMWVQINGQLKIEIASSVLTNSITELAEDNKVGLIAYGLRKKAIVKM